MVAPVLANAAHADQVPTIGTAVEPNTSTGGARRSVVEELRWSLLDHALNGESAQAAQVTSVSRWKATIGMRVVGATPSIKEALRWSFWVGHLTAPDAPL